MAERHADIVILGAGIAGLWTFHRLKSLGYDALLLESAHIGGGQSIASQGIIHSGLKYAFAGQINKLAQSISAMPDRWRAALAGQGDVDLSRARVNASSQYLLIPAGFMGGLITLVTRKALGGNVQSLKQADWPEPIRLGGFSGQVVYMDEPVLDVPSALRALAEPYKDAIRRIDTPDDLPGFLKRHNITARKILFTAAATNADMAARLGQQDGLRTQHRPLKMAMLKPAPFDLYAHLVGSSDKPVATITTHIAADGALVWYIGGQVAERGPDVPDQEIIRAAQNALARYLPQIRLDHAHWATLAIERVEGTSNTEGWMPDTPNVHEKGDHYYGWPTKLTFAPLLADKIIEKLTTAGVAPSGAHSDWSDLPEAPSYAATPWDCAQWS